MRKLHFGQGPDFIPTLIRLAGPVALQNLINQSLVLLDTFMGGALGEAELAAMTLAGIVTFVITVFLFGIQSGAMVLIGQYWGKGDPKAINRVLGISLLLSGTLGLLAAAGGLFFAGSIASVLTNDTGVSDIAARYLRFAMPSLLLNGLNTAYTTARRSMEAPRVGLVVHTASAVTNTFLNWVLIFGNLGAPALGIEGAGISMLLSRSLESLIVVSFVILDPRFRLMPRHLFRPGRVIFRDYMHFALPVLLNEMLWSSGFSLYPIIMGHLPGSAAGVAAYSLANALEKVLTSVSAAMAAASAVMIGKGLGEGKDQAEMHSLGCGLLNLTLGYGICAALLMVLMAFFLLPVLLPLFALSSDAKYTAFTMMLLFAVLLPSHANNYCGIAGILRSGGDVRLSAVVDVLAMYLFGIPLAAFLGLGLGMGAVSGVIGMIAEEYSKGIWIQWRVHQGKWLKNITRDTY